MAGQPANGGRQTWTPEQVMAERARLAAEDPEGEGDAVHPLRSMTPADWDRELEAAVEATPERPDVEIPYPIPEDRGYATLSDLGTTVYVDDLIRPGRIVVVAAEEGTGKSYAIAGELAIRVAVAGGSFAGTWPVMVTGPVLVMSEMHPDDDYQREGQILDALGLERGALAGALYRLSLMTAADKEPALLSDRWLAWIARWLEAKKALMLIVDTATGASLVDPWGKDIQAVYRRLRTLLEDCPQLAIVLVVHLRKPQGKGERRISDVLGEWGRWCDVLLLLEHDGGRTKLSTRKRVQKERKVAATKRDGLLVEPLDLNEMGSAPKVAPETVLEVIRRQPGLSYTDLAEALGVGKATASRYIGQLASQVVVLYRKSPEGKGRAAASVYLAEDNPTPELLSDEPPPF